MLRWRIGFLGTEMKHVFLSGEITPDRWHTHTLDGMLPRKNTGVIRLLEVPIKFYLEAQDRVEQRIRRQLPLNFMWQEINSE
jgi:hypothetical protein